MSSQEAHDDYKSTKHCLPDWTEELSGVWTGISLALFSSSSCCPALVWREVRLCPVLQTTSERCQERPQSTYLSVSRTQHNSTNWNKVGPIIIETIQRKDESKPLKEYRAAKPVSPLSCLCPEGEATHSLETCMLNAFLAIILLSYSPWFLINECLDAN